MFKKLILASHNAHKVRELAALLQPLGIEITSLSSVNAAEPDEPHETFIENALVKARHASKHTRFPALADDSGLCVPALEGEPGVRSARYSGQAHDDARNNAILLDNMRNVDNRQAFFYCALVLVLHEHDPCPLIAEGRWYGEILKQPVGENGFGYDPVFYVPSMRCSAAQLTPEHKNQFSHRGIAMRHLLARLRDFSDRS